MTSAPPNHIVYNKDGEGSTYAVSEEVYEGRILQCGPGFVNVVDTLAKLKSFKTRPDDIWIIDFMKSGNDFLHVRCCCICTDLEIPTEICP